MSDLWPWMSAGAVVVLLLRLAWRVDGPRPTGGNLRGGDAYCPPPPPANPPTPPRREVYVLSGSPGPTVTAPKTPNAPRTPKDHSPPPTPRTPNTPNAAPMPGRPRSQPIRVLIAHETCPKCGHRAGEADVAGEDDERTVLDDRGGVR